jgi:hypothetical protein
LVAGKFFIAGTLQVSKRRGTEAYLGFQLGAIIPGRGVDFHQEKHTSSTGSVGFNPKSAWGAVAGIFRLFTLAQRLRIVDRPVSI